MSAPTVAVAVAVLEDLAEGCAHDERHLDSALAVVAAVRHHPDLEGVYGVDREGLDRALADLAVVRASLRETGTTLREATAGKEKA